MKFRDFFILSGVRRNATGNGGNVMPLEIVETHIMKRHIMGNPAPRGRPGASKMPHWPSRWSQDWLFKQNDSILEIS